MPSETLISAATMAAENPVRIPGESAEYRAARTALLTEEIELRRHIERVAEQRRALPPGAPITGNYRFMAEDGSTTDFGGLFGSKETLGVYSFMFGPKMKRPCPMCTNLLGAFDGNAADAAQLMSFVVVARSPIERLIAYKKERGWQNLRLYSDLNDLYSQDFHGVSDKGDDIPSLNIFTRRDGTLRHFWAGEMPKGDPGQDPRGAPDLAPLWTILDTTPCGRPPEWYPSLEYPTPGLVTLKL